MHTIVIRRRHVKRHPLAKIEVYDDNKRLIAQSPVSILHYFNEELKMVGVRRTESAPLLWTYVYTNNITEIKYDDSTVLDTNLTAFYYPQPNFTA